MWISSGLLSFGHAFLDQASGCLRALESCLLSVGMLAADETVSEGAGNVLNDKLADRFADFIIIGLTMNIVGIFFLANSIIFKRPRKVIEEFFTHEPGTLAEIRDYIFTKIQVMIGFLFIFCGFGLQVVAHVDELVDPTLFLVISIAVILATAFLVGTIGYGYSRRAFRRYLKDFFRRNPWPFERNMNVTQEVGELFGIPKSAEDTVEVYVAKLRRQLRLPGGDKED